MKRENRVPAAIGAVGIVIEVIAIALLASGRLRVPVAAPLVILGMLLAFVPLFVLARRAKRPR